VKTVFVVLSNEYRRRRNHTNVYHGVWLSDGSARAAARRLAFEYMKDNRIYTSSDRLIPSRVRETDAGEFSPHRQVPLVGFSSARASILVLLARRRATRISDG